MKMRRLAQYSMALFSVCCLGQVQAQKPAPKARKAAKKGHLHLAAFELRMEGHKKGQVRIQVLRGDGAGNIVRFKAQGKGKLVRQKPTLHIDSQGNLRVGSQSAKAKIRLTADGKVVANGKTLPMWIDKKGSMFRMVGKSKKPVFELRRGALVDLTPGKKMTYSKITVNGKVISKTRWLVTYKASNKTRRLIGFVLGLSLLAAPAAPHPQGKPIARPRPVARPSP